MPLDPAAQAAGERGRRRRAIVFFGLLLLGSLFIPDLVPSGQKGFQVQFPTLELLGAGGVPAIVKFLAVFPAAGGLLAIILAFVSDARWRGAVLALLPWVPLIVVAVQAGTFAPLSRELDALTANAPWPLIAGALSIPVLWVVARARYWRPGYGWLYWPALAAAGAFTVSQVVPARGGSETLPVNLLLTALTQSPDALSKTLASTVLIALALLALASLLAALNFPGRRPSIRGQAGGAFRLTVVAVVLLLVATQIPTITLLARQEARTALPAAVALVRTFLQVGGLALLFLSGLVELIIGRSRTAELAIN